MVMKSFFFILRLSLIFWFAGLLSYHGFAQARYGVNDTLLVGAVIYNGDTIPARILPCFMFGKALSIRKNGRG